MDKVLKNIGALKNPTSMIGAFLLIFIGIYFAFSTQMSVSASKEGSDTKTKEIPRFGRVAIGLIILLIGSIIFFTHIKKQD